MSRGLKVAWFLPGWKHGATCHHASPSWTNSHRCWSASTPARQLRAWCIRTSLSFFTNVWMEWLISHLTVLVHAKLMDPNVVITYLLFSLNSESVLTHSTPPTPAIAATTAEAEIESRSQVSYEPGKPKSRSSARTTHHWSLSITMSSGRIE